MNHTSLALLVLAALTCVASVIAFVDLIVGGRSIPKLAEQPLLVGATPRVSVLIAARDEARDIERALDSVLRQAYASYEVIVVDDRSADDTGAILDRMAREWPALRVVHITELPPGWLGKNHALERGAESATGELLLFSDADVVFDSSALSRAVRYLLDHDVDHVTVAPGLVLPTVPLTLVVNFFALWFSLYMRPWRARVAGSRWHMGVGAFSLVRASSYRAAGTHRRIAMRPDDDIKLGKILKASGARQHVLTGREMITVEWYRTLGELVRGLRKNALAGLEYSVPFVLFSSIASLAANVWPFAAVWITTGLTRALYAATALILMAMYALVAWSQKQRPWLALLYPVAALIFLYIVCAATMRTLWRGGIEWRGTYYSLDELRANKV